VYDMTHTQVSDRLDQDAVYFEVDERRPTTAVDLQVPPSLIRDSFIRGGHDSFICIYICET